MAMFGKSKKDEPSGDGDAGAPDAKPAKGKRELTIEPEKAEKFFEHARSMVDRANYEYAMTLWLQGLRKDPTNMAALEAFFDASANFLVRNPKAKGPTKDQAKQFGGKGPLEKYLSNLLQWATKPQGDWTSGLRAMDAAATLDLNEPAHWIGEKVLALASHDRKAKKDHFVQLMNAFDRIGGYDKAAEAGERAMAMDRSDGKLEARVRNMSATATMTRGGYETTGEAGGFRKNIKDLEGQRQKEEEEATVKTEETLDRLIERAANEYRQRADDVNTIQKLGKYLLERGTPDDEKAALRLFTQAYKTTSNFRFKVMAGDLQIRVARRKLAALKQKMEASPGDEALRQQFEKAQTQVLEFERAQFEERVEAAPTDMKLRYELGLRCFRLRDHEAAIAAFQEAQSVPGYGSRVRNYLGQCFEELGWMEEAIGTYRSAIEQHPTDSDDMAMELRYGLMRSLQRKAEEKRRLPDAEEALKLASDIAIKQINYRDIRDRRTSIGGLVEALKSGA
jgi:tetratricopeptide (TPR) repeat protein